MWQLIAVEREPGLAQPSPETSEPGFPPSYHGDGAEQQASARAQTTESERNDFGTIVTEVTTVTTRRRYRVEDV